MSPRRPRPGPPAIPVSRYRLRPWAPHALAVQGQLHQGGVDRVDGTLQMLREDQREIAGPPLTFLDRLIVTVPEQQVPQQDEEQENRQQSQIDQSCVADQACPRRSETALPSRASFLERPELLTTLDRRNATAARWGTLARQAPRAFPRSDDSSAIFITSGVRLRPAPTTGDGRPTCQACLERDGPAAATIS